MNVVGLYEAKANFSKLVDQVAKTGQPVTITLRGDPAAVLVPHRPDDGNTPRTKVEVLARMREIARGLPKTGIDQIKKDIEEGRR